MIKRTTIEIDEKLLADAKKSLGCPTTRATVEEALRRAVAASEGEREERRERAENYFKSLSEHADMDILASDEMWR
jgi:Arc/MetJ family transcription regulator